MRGIGILSIALAGALAVACNGNGRNDTAANTTTGTSDSAVGTAGERANTDVSRGDRDFVTDQLVAGMAEIELGKMAAQKGASARVKQFGQMMVDDHTKAGNELKQVVATFGITEPTQLDDKHRDLQEKLSKLSGAEFDREYMDAMVDGHQDVIDQLESRVDKDSLNVWNTNQSKAAADGARVETRRSAQANARERAQEVGGKVATDEHGNTTVIKPESSDNHTTAMINQWAATTLPTAMHHLDEAKTLKDNLGGRGRNSTR